MTYPLRGTHAVGNGPRGEVGDQPSCAVSLVDKDRTWRRKRLSGSLSRTLNGSCYMVNTMWRVSQDWDRMLGEETGPGLENGASRRRANFPVGLVQCARVYSGEHQLLLCGLVLSVKKLRRLPMWGSR
jgi:hypothetical protein